ncbi:hypothetical protein J8F10_06410 [Gemmata sp. G18]|uniref:DUF3987 domain-containing protein n=1 Tax=Gemmata palustris TaxID=2822762 RepID=A0ABS5BN69_9BACT|nr:hypothetical protein [Gemmata palustris]MBP3954912.1 hypothetical protein [Gemmata palustris]
MKRPVLSKEAAKFWDRHARRCENAGLLNEATLDAFVLLCRTYALLQFDPEADERTGVIKWVALCKNFERQGMAFGITAKKLVEKPRDLAAIIREGLNAGQDEPREAN